MNNYKYSLICKYDNIKTAQKFREDLEKIGYSFAVGDKILPPTMLGVAMITNGNSYLENGELGCCTGSRNRDFTFNIDNKWEYESALAIAAIRDDDKPHVGEWIKALKSGELVSGNLYKIRKTKEDLTCNTPSQDAICVEGIESGDYSGTTNLNGRYCRKATPEEIIEYMKKKYKASTLPEKWYIPSAEIKDKEDFKSWYKQNFHRADFTAYYYWNKQYGFANIIPQGYERITYEQWKEWYDYHNKPKEIELEEKPKNWYCCFHDRKEADEIVNFIEQNLGYYPKFTYIGRPGWVGMNKNGIVTSDICPSNIPDVVYYNNIKSWREIFKPETTKTNKMKSFSIKGPINQYPDLLEFFNSKERYDLSDTIYRGLTTDMQMYSYDVIKDKVGTECARNAKYTLVTYNQWKNMYYADKKIIGYKLIKEYPNAEIGVGNLLMKEKYQIFGFENFDFSKFSEFWEPVYEQEKKEITIRVECDEPFNVTVIKGDTIKCPENNITIGMLRDIKKLVTSRKLNSWNFEINTVNIGCKKNIPFKYLDEIIKAWKELNEK